MDDDEEHLVLFDRVRLLGIEQFVELQIFPVGLRRTEVPVHRLALQIDLVVGHVVSDQLSENTQRGTVCQPRTSSRSSARQSAHAASTASQKRGEWFMCFTCVSSCTIR